MVNFSSLDPRNLRGMPILGYETHQRVSTGDVRPKISGREEFSLIAFDVGSKLLGYVPVLNIIVGVGRLLLALAIHIAAKYKNEKLEDCHKRFITYLVGRGVVEIVGFGVGTMFLDFGKATITYIIIKNDWHNKVPRYRVRDFF